MVLQVDRARLDGFCLVSQAVSARWWLGLDSSEGWLSCLVPTLERLRQLGTGTAGAPWASFPVVIPHGGFWSPDFLYGSSWLQRHMFQKKEIQGKAILPFRPSLGSHICHFHLLLIRAITCPHGVKRRRQAPPLDGEWKDSGRAYVTGNIAVAILWKIPSAKTN